MEMEKTMLTKPYALPHTETWSICSQEMKRIYKIFLSVPDSPPPDDGFPIMYVLDGNSVFASFTETMNLQTSRADITGKKPHIIVGIGYETTGPFNDNRYYDLTFSPDIDFLSYYPIDRELPQAGGGEYFLTFIEKELKPQIEQKYDVNKEKQAIIGHSLGGLFVLSTLFTSPSSFQYYIASSPSIHWNEAFLNTAKQQFLASEMKANLLITSGELERDHFSQMNEKAKMLNDELQKHTTAVFKSEFLEFPGEDHMTVLPPLINKSILFVNEIKTQIK